VARITILLANVLAVAVLAVGATASGGAARVASLETQLLERVNALRQAAGAPALQLHGGLSRAAERHSYEMVSQGYFGHRSADGSSFRSRIAATYARGTSHWHVAENIAWRAGDTGSVSIVSLWLASARHRANLLNPRFRDAGVAAVRTPRASGIFGGQAATVVTLDLGRR
jgi:uncharacterized protein YkwD